MVCSRAKEDGPLRCRDRARVSSSCAGGGGGGGTGAGDCEGIPAPVRGTAREAAEAAFAIRSFRRSLRSERLAAKKVSGTLTPADRPGGVLDRSRGRVLRVDTSREEELVEEAGGRSRLLVQATSPLLFLITCTPLEEEAEAGRGSSGGRSPWGAAPAGCGTIFCWFPAASSASRRR